MKPLDARTSDAMSRVRQKRTGPEDRVARALRRLGMAYRRNVRSLPGTPDFANQKQGWAIQVHGCFWHNHDCPRGTVPQNNRQAWLAKLNRNKVRDAEAERALVAHGLAVLILWECELKDEVRLEEKIASHLR